VTNPGAGAQGQTRPEANTYYAQHDFDGTARLSTTVIHALSEVANVDTTNTESTLFQHVDPDALDSLFKPTGPEAPRANGRMSFQIWGYDVTVFGTGRIVITPLQQSTQPPAQHPTR
jgi:hypothetical protein